MTAADARFREWRAAVLQGGAVTEADADELEGHLREQMLELEAVGLTEDEAFLVSVRRMGQTDHVSDEYARVHGDRLWKQLAIPSRTERQHSTMPMMLTFAVIAAVFIEVAWRIAVSSDYTVVEGFVRNQSFFVLPVLAAYFAAARRMPWRRAGALASTVAVLALAVNLFPFGEASTTGTLVALHLPIALWFVVGAAYVGGDVKSSAKLMDFIRFTGEWAIYYAMIAIGGAILVGLTAMVLTPIVPGAVTEVTQWMVTMGAAGAVIVAAWLVEAKKSVIENIAPVLTAIFTPLFAAMLLVAAATYASVGLGRDFDRELIAGFDALLLVVLALVLYGISAPMSQRWDRVLQIIRLVAVVAAIILDLLVLVAMFARIGEYGFTANRVAALGLNLILLANLAASAWLTVRALTTRSPAGRLERWQTGYLFVFAGWAALMVLALPPVFGFA